MDVFHWYLLSNIVWPIFIITIVLIKASWIELLVVAVLVNSIGQVSIPSSYYFTIFINTVFFIAFLYGGFRGKFKNKTS